MIKEVLTWIEIPGNGQAAALIAGVTGIVSVIIGALLKLVFDNSSVNHKVKFEYSFSQRTSIKTVLSKSKTPLIKACEELNYRLWNLRSHIDERWHNIPEVEWRDSERYYLRSFVYRILLFWYWLQKSEDSIYNLDFSTADRGDRKYLKYVKTLKHFLCERELLKELGYGPNGKGHHFYKDDIPKYVGYISHNDKPLSYPEFEALFREDLSQIIDVVRFVTCIRNNRRNLNYNMIMCFHLFLMRFLNEYGLDYHKTNLIKYIRITNYYHPKIKIHDSLRKFLKRNKVGRMASILLGVLSQKVTKRKLNKSLRIGRSLR